PVDSGLRKQGKCVGPGAATKPRGPAPAGGARPGHGSVKGRAASMTGRFPTRGVREAREPFGPRDGGDCPADPTDCRQKISVFYPSQGPGLGGRCDAGADTLEGSWPDASSRPGPCALSCSNDHEVYGFHPGGANASFADRHVQLPSAGLGLPTLAALITRAGG